jgi:hypothetical protein
MNKKLYPILSLLIFIVLPTIVFAIYFNDYKYMTLSVSETIAEKYSCNTCAHYKTVCGIYARGVYLCTEVCANYLDTDCTRYINILSNGCVITSNEKLTEYSTYVDSKGFCYDSMREILICLIIIYCSFLVGMLLIYYIANR